MIKQANETKFPKNLYVYWDDDCMIAEDDLNEAAPPAGERRSVAVYALVKQHVITAEVKISVDC